MVVLTTKYANCGVTTFTTAKLTTRLSPYYMPLRCAPNNESAPTYHSPSRPRWVTLEASPKRSSEPLKRSTLLCVRCASTSCSVRRMFSVLHARVGTPRGCLRRDNFPSPCLSRCCAVFPPKKKEATKHVGSWEYRVHSSRASHLSSISCSTLVQQQMLSLAKLFSCPGCVLPCILVPKQHIDPGVKRAELRIQELVHQAGAPHRCGSWKCLLTTLMTISVFC